MNVTKQRERQRQHTLERIESFIWSIERDLELATREVEGEDDTSGRLGSWDGEPELPFYNLADNEIRQALNRLSKLIQRLVSRSSVN